VPVEVRNRGRKCVMEIAILWAVIVIVMVIVVVIGIQAS
jgi:hypothetical protein